MLVQYYYPLSLSPTLLDKYLSKGWFRNASLMYKTHLICIDNDYSSVLNIRLPVKTNVLPKRLRKLERQNGKRFSYKVQKLRITERKRELYDIQKNRFDGFIYHELDQFFYGDFDKNQIFNTYEVCVYDKDKLIAVSYFDKGKNSIASLLALYDPEYQKYSLGTYTMILELKYAKEQSYNWYYPGYVLDKSSVFDYKLRLGEMQYLDVDGMWKPKAELDFAKFPSSILRDKVDRMKRTLSMHNIEFEYFLYPLFSIGYFEFEYVKTPACILIDSVRMPGLKYVLEYDIESEEFQLSQVFQHSIDQEMANVQISDKLLESNSYYLKLLTYEHLVFSNTNLGPVVEFIKRNL